jgi:hypothetical protein
LVLHQAGFVVPPALLTERWSLTPPFHLYPAHEAKDVCFL